MFYHRQMAYRMVQDYEKEHGFKFDWVRNQVLQALGWRQDIRSGTKAMTATSYIQCD